MAADCEHNSTHFNVTTPIANHVNVERNVINNNEISTKWQSEKIKWQDVMPEITVEPPVSVLNPLATEFKIDNKETVVKQIAGNIDSDYSCDKAGSQRKLKGKIEGVKVEFLCDTGADSTVLSIKCYETLPLDVKRRLQDSAGSVYMPDGRQVMCKSPILCNMEVGGEQISEVIYVADIEDYALLGWDAQLALDIQYTIAGIDLTKIRRAGSSLNNTKVRLVRTNENYIIPPRSEFVVQAKLPDECKGTVLVSDIKEINESNGFIVGRTIVNGDNKECAVRVMNVTEQPKILKKGDLLGGVEEIDELYTEEMETQTTSDVLPSYLQELYD